MLIVKISCVFFLCLSLICYFSENSALDPFWLPHSYSYTAIKRTRPSFTWRLVRWTAFLVLPVILWVLQHIEPLMNSGNWNLQPPLELWKDPLVKEYEEIFKHFDFSVLPIPKRGPKRNTLEVYAQVFLIKVNQKLHSSSELRTFFCDHPQLIPLVGFSPIYNTMTGILDLEKTVVSARHLRRKLQTIENQHLKLLLKQTVDQLHAQNLLKGTAIADTTEILACLPVGRQGSKKITANNVSATALTRPEPSKVSQNARWEQSRSPEKKITRENPKSVTSGGQNTLR